MDLATVLLVGITIAVLYIVFTSNPIKVEVKARECVVMINLFTGRQIVWGLKKGEVGTSYWPLWWTIDQRVNLNYERIYFGAASSEQTDDKITVETRSSDSVGLLMRGSFFLWIGRPWLETNGRVTGTTPSARAIRSVVNKIDYADHQKYVVERVRQAVDSVCGSIKARPLLVPEDGKPQIPNEIDEAGEKPVKVESIAKRDAQLAIAIKSKANFLLRTLGLSIDEVSITDLRYEDPAQQVELEKKHKLENTVIAKKALDGQNLTDAEKLAIHTPEFGKVVLGEAAREFSGAVVEAVRVYKGQGGRQRRP